MKFKSNSALRYTVYGALFGLTFPVISFILVYLFNTTITVLLAVIASAPLFLGIFARFAGVRQDRINEVNQGLEETVAQRTRSIRNLLDVSGEGYLSFGPDYLVKTEYSLACRELLGAEIAGVPIDNLLFEKPEKRQEFRQGLDLFFTGRSRGDVIFDILDNETHHGDKTLELDFKVIADNEVLCALKDVSALRALAEVRHRDAREQQIVFQVISHKAYFSSFTREADELFERAGLVNSATGAGEYKAIQRKIHTFKGNSSFFRFDATQSAAHDLEYYIADRLVLEEDIALDGAIIPLKKAYYDEADIVERRLGTSWISESETVSIPLGRYRGLESYVRKSYPGDRRLLGALKGFRTVSMASLFVRFPDMAERIAEQAGKQIDPLIIQGGEFQVLPERYEALTGSFVHLVRNMVDHGIEPASERELKNKSPEGHLKIILESSGNEITMAFSDDGKGISLHAIQNKARETGLISAEANPTRKELYSMLFRHDFSTAENVTEISGRGHGLPAVKDEVDRLGGRISITTTAGKGTTFKISIPSVSREKRNK